MSGQSSVISFGHEQFPAHSDIVVVEGAVSRLGLFSPMWLFKPRHAQDYILENLKIISKITQIPGVIVAGGIVSRIMDPTLDSLHATIGTTASDIDIYIRANNAETAYSTIHKLLAVFTPIGDAVLTKYALSFEISQKSLLQGSDAQVPVQYQEIYRVLRSYEREGVTTPVHKIQIISQLVPDTGDIYKDIGDVILNYDLSCCSFAVDANGIYATRAAMTTMFETRIVRVYWSRLTSAIRLAKYFKRAFDFEIEGPNGELLSIGPDSQAASAIHHEFQNTPEMKTVYTPEGEDGLGEHKQSSYEKMTLICNGGTSPLSVIMQNYYDSEDDDSLMMAVCGDPEYIMRNGKCSDSYILDWKCMAMNEFCDKLLTSVPPPSQEHISTATSEFAIKIGHFVNFVTDKLRVPNLFSNGHRPLQKLNTDYDAFKQYWGIDSQMKKQTLPPCLCVCEPCDTPTNNFTSEQDAISIVEASRKRVAVADIDGEPPTKRARRIARANVFTPRITANVPNTPMLHVHDIITTVAGGGKLMLLGLQNGSKLMAITPEMELPCWFPIWHPQNVPVNVLCSLGRFWASDVKLSAFRHFMDDIQQQCIKLIKEAQLHRPYHIKDETLEESFTPIIEEREGFSINSDTVSKFPPSIRFNIPDMDNSSTNIIAMSDEGKLVPLDIGSDNRLFKNTIQARIRLDWVYRKKRSNPQGWRFSVRWTIVQAIVRTYK